MVEEVRVSAAFNPFAQPTGERSRQEVRQRKQAPLRGVQDVDVLNRFIQFPILGITQAIRVDAFEQHAGERVEKVQVLRRRLQAKGIDRDAALPQADFEIAAVEQGR